MTLRLLTIAIALAGAPAIAASQDSTAQTPPTIDQTAADDDAQTPQPTEKEQKALNRCKRMTAQQRAQSSKCTKLMEKFHINERERDPLAGPYG